MPIPLVQVGFIESGQKTCPFPQTNIMNMIHVKDIDTEKIYF